MCNERKLVNELKPLFYKIDLTELEGDGDFKCPKCGVVISPDDWSGSVYEIIEKKERNNELEELIIQCNKCGSKISLYGWLQI